VGPTIKDVLVWTIALGILGGVVGHVVSKDIGGTVSGVFIGAVMGFGFNVGRIIRYI
jgi:hypothetical protein